MKRKLPCIPQPSSHGHYTYKCVKCGTPHRHRTENKYPELCSLCAKRQSRLDYWNAKKVAEANNKAITGLFKNISIDLAKTSARFGGLSNA